MSRPPDISETIPKIFDALKKNFDDAKDEFNSKKNSDPKNAANDLIKNIKEINDEISHINLSNGFQEDEVQKNIIIKKKEELEKEVKALTEEADKIIKEADKNLSTTATTAVTTLTSTPTSTPLAAPAPVTTPATPVTTPAATGTAPTAASAVVDYTKVKIVGIKTKRNITAPNSYIPIILDAFDLISIFKDILIDENFISNDIYKLIIKRKKMENNYKKSDFINYILLNDTDATTNLSCGKILKDDEEIIKFIQSFFEKEITDVPLLNRTSKPLKGGKKSRKNPRTRKNPRKSKKQKSNL